MSNRIELKRICLFSNYNLYESKRYFTQKLAEALQRCGVEVKILEKDQGIFDSKTFEEIYQFKPNLTCSFNSLMPFDDGQQLPDFLAIPHLACLVDPSFYSTVLTRSPYTIISCVDRSDCEVILSTGFSNVLFLPHAVERELSAEDGEERPYDIVMLGTCYDYETLRLSWRECYPKYLSKVLDDAIDFFSSHEKSSLAQALVAAWNLSHLDHKDVKFEELYYYLDYYIRGRDRVELIRSIKDIPVHIFGSLSQDKGIESLGWSDYLVNQSNVTIHPSLTFSNALGILKHSKFALNSMPFFRDGSHERVFIALACGCLSVSSESHFLHEEFKEEEGVIFYNSKTSEGWINDQIVKLLSDESRRLAAAKVGREKVMQRHTWDQRAELLLKTLPPMIEGMPR